LSEAARRRFFHSRIWRRLTAPAPDEVARGAVFRLPPCAAGGPAQDYLLVEHGGDSGFALVVAAGARAGSVSVVLPKEAVIADADAVSRAWVISNWRRRIFDGCTPRDVMLADRYPAPR
jgi:hypothetical protein